MDTVLSSMPNSRTPFLLQCKARRIKNFYPPPPTQAAGIEAIAEQIQETSSLKLSLQNELK
jgi:hypothetical protein